MERYIRVLPKSRTYRWLSCSTMNNAPPAIAAPRLVPFMRTRWDTNQNIAEALEQKNYLNALYGTSTYIRDGLIGMQIHLILGRGAALLYRVEDVESMTYCFAVANAVAPGLQHLPEAEANAQVVTCLVQFLQTEITKRGLIEISENDWAKLTRAAREGVEAGPWANIAWIPRSRDQVKDMPYPEAVTKEEMTRVFAHLIAFGRKILVEEGPATMFAAAFLGFAKKGEITTRKLETVVAQMKDEIGYNMALTPQLIKAVWQHVGAYVPYEFLPQMFKAWETSTEVVSLRMRVTLQQAAWTGLTQYSTILQMVEEHPDFPWAKVASLLASDWAAFMKAVEVVGNDPYYGFKANIGDAAATKFLNLGYVAKEMVKKLGGREAGAITQYKGWITTPRCQATLDDMIKAWVPGGAAGPIVPDEQAVAALRTKLRNVRLQGQADPRPLPDHDGHPVNIPAAIALDPAADAPADQQMPGAGQPEDDAEAEGEGGDQEGDGEGDEDAPGNAAPGVPPPLPRRHH